MSYRQRLPMLVCLDIVIVWIAMITSYLFEYNGLLNTGQWRQWVLFGLIYTVIHTSMMHVFKLYNRIWQYASVGELISIIKAVTTASVISYMTSCLLSMSIMPPSLGVRIFESTLLLTGGSRFTWRVFRDYYFGKKLALRRALIIGAGDCGTLIAKELKSDRNTFIQPVAFIDDDPNKRNLQVLDLPVYGSRYLIREAVEKLAIDDIIIAIPSISRKETSQIIEECKQTKAKLKIIPKIGDLINGKINVKEIRDVDVEDLLGREPIRIELQDIVGYLKGKTVLITGAGGSIGSELCRQIAHFNPGMLLLLGHGENSIYAIEMELNSKYPDQPIETIIADVQDKARVQEVFVKYRPQVVFHAAAHKHVPLMERNPAEAIKNNVFGTRNVADTAHLFGVERFILISTDKAVNPTSVMGTTKRIAEMYIQSLNSTSSTIFASVRFGNVLGSRGSVIPRFKEQISTGGPVTVTHPKMIRFFMTIPEAVQLVIQAGSIAQGGEVFVLDMGEPVKILDLAKDLIRLSGYEPGIDIDIEYSGMRPGEKLYEELLTDEEGLSSTKHNRIFVAKPPYLHRSELELELNKLDMVLEREGEYIRQVLHSIVPTYCYSPADRIVVDQSEQAKSMEPLLV